MTERIGNQTPRIALEPKSAYSDGEDAAILVSAYGFDLDPWQKQVINVWLGRDKNDKFTATSCGLSVPRQNGKNALLEVRELYGLVSMGEKLLHTAHEVKTARKAFNRLCGFFENERQYPELAAMVKTIRKTNGQEAIELKNEGSVEFSARSRGAARGFTVDSVIFDEAQELSDEQLEALLPTLAAAPSGNRQFIYTGTPPAPNSRGEVFCRTRKTALDKEDPSLAWHEWSVENLPDKNVSIDDLVRFSYEVNPALGYRITSDFVRKEALQMSLDGFSRERLGWWQESLSTIAIAPQIWRETFIDPKDAPRGGIKTFGVKFSSDGVHVALAACRKTDDDKFHVECVKTGIQNEGLQWIVDFLSETTRADETAAIAIDGKSGTGYLFNELSRVYPRAALIVAGTKGVIDASSMFEQALREKNLTHTNTDDGAQDELDLCVANAIKRPIGNDGGWSYDGENSTPLESCALALYAAKITNRDPRRKAVVW